jgi:hypothetical protein
VIVCCIVNAEVINIEFTIDYTTFIRVLQTKSLVPIYTVCPDTLLVSPANGGIR